MNRKLCGVLLGIILPVSSSNGVCVNFEDGKHNMSYGEYNFVLDQYGASSKAEAVSSSLNEKGFGKVVLTANGVKVEKIEGDFGKNVFCYNVNAYRNGITGEVGYDLEDVCRGRRMSAVFRGKDVVDEDNVRGAAVDIVFAYGKAVQKLNEEAVEEFNRKKSLGDRFVHIN